MEDRIALADDVATPTADLMVTIAPATAPVHVGDQVTYNLTVTNNGPDDATNVVVVDTLPANVTFDAGAAGNSSGLIPYNNMVIDLVGNLAAGASTTISIVVTPNAAAQGTVLHNTAVVTGLPTDPNPFNNIATDDTVFVQPVVNVSITKSVQTAVPGVVGAGQPLTYTLTVSNTGLSNASFVVVGDLLPVGITTTTADITAPGGNIIQVGDPSSQLFAVVYPTLPAGATQTITIHATATGPFTQSTTVTNIGFIQGMVEQNTSTQTFGIAQTLVDVSPLAVTSVARYGYHNIPTVLGVRFNKPLDPATALNLNNYSLVSTTGGFNSFNFNSIIPLTNVSYDPGSNQVLLYPNQLLPLAGTYVLTVTGVTDAVGNPLVNGTYSTIINRNSLQGQFPPVSRPPFRLPG
jgi:uncharacterized repeat protein (TIGR01451 family)